MVFDWKLAQLETPARGSLLSMFKTTSQTSVATDDDNSQRALTEMSNTIKSESPNGKFGDTQKRALDSQEKVVASPTQLKKAKPSPNKKKGNNVASSTITSFFKPAPSGM